MPELYPYQEKYLNGMPKNIIMTADVGLGKTIMALEHARRHDVTMLVVIAPASKVRTGDWQREIHSHLPELHDYTVLSYEGFVKRHHELIGQDVTLIIDECHMACNASTKRAKAIIKVASTAKQWIGLSATPLPNGWKSAETYSILTRLARNKTEFVRRFERIDRSRGFPMLLGYNELDVLNRWWAATSKPLRRDGNLKLPSRLLKATVSLSPALAKVYKKAIQERVYGDEVLDNSSKLFNTLRQIPTPARLDALQNILNDTNEHVVVFYNYNTEREAILELLDKQFKERTIYEQSGHMSRLPAREDWDTLASSITLVQYQSGSQAIELTYASVTVYFSPCTSYANYEQSKGRTRRNGQAKTTIFYHVAAEGTLDRHIWQIIGTKQDFAIEMMDKILQQ